MIAVDTNIAVYAHRRDFTQHERARAALAGLAETGRAWALPWPCLHELVAVVTNPRVFTTPTTPSDAVGVVAELLDLPGARPLAESSTHLRRMSDLLAPGTVRGPRVHDARVAAICLDHGVSELWTADRDFSWFPQLVTSNPVA